MHTGRPGGLNTMDAVFHNRTLFGPESQGICRMKKEIRRRLTDPHVLGTENPAFEPRQQPCLSQCSPYFAVGPAGGNTMWQPQPVEGIFDSIHSTQMPVKRPLVPALIPAIPTCRQGDSQVFFDLGHKVRFGFSNEAPDYLVKFQIPAKIGEDALVHPDSNGFGIYQDPVAIEDHQLER